jgi:membrane associated rhomboid family serine protease
MFSFLNNIPQVTKNILLLNILFFVLKYFFTTQGMDLDRVLGAYYINSPLFEPYQIVSHFFMHGDLMHIFLNMWLFVMLGTFLEQLWGPKRFFIFYIASALGAFALYNIIGAYQIYEIKQQLATFLDVDSLNRIIETSYSPDELITNVNQYLHTLPNQGTIQIAELTNYISYTGTPLVGASGAVFGILAAFAILFPNTEFMLYFAIPVKAKFLVSGYFLYELYKSFNGTPGDNVAHLAHVGGAIVGAIIILVWRKTDKQNFW